MKEFVRAIAYAIAIVEETAGLTGPLVRDLVRTPSGKNTLSLSNFITVAILPHQNV